MSKLRISGKEALFFLLVTIITVSCSSVDGFSVPKYDKNHQDALSNNGSKGDLGSWHGLDYEYGAFDHSEWVEKMKKRNESKSKKTNGTNLYEDFYLDDDGSSEENYSWGDYNSEEDYSYVDDIIIVGRDKTKGSTGKPKGETTKKEWHGLITIGAKKATSPGPTLKAVENGDKAKENIEKDYSWEETPGDSDDGEGGDEKKPKKGEGKTNLGDLPTDNDLDSDKYFNPDRYKDTLTLHAIEDLLMRQWTVNYPDTNLPCIMLKGSIKLVVPLNPTWYNKDFIEIDVPYDAEASGTCASLKNDYQEIILNWNVTVGESKLTYLNKIVLGFATNWTSEFTDLNIPEDKYALVAVTAAYYKGELGEKAEDTGIVSYSANDLVEFMTPLNQSMSCYQSKQIILGSMQLTMSGIQLEAFRPNKDTLTAGEFSRSVLCSMDEVFVFDAVMTFIIWFWIGALLIVLAIFVVLLALGYRRRQGHEEGFGYKILTA